MAAEQGRTEHPTEPAEGGLEQGEEAQERVRRQQEQSAEPNDSDDDRTPTE